MTMQPFYPLALTLALLAAATTAPARAAEPPDDEVQAMSIQRSIDQARKELDDAARKLASLHSRMWHLETAGPRAQRPILGVLVDDTHTGPGMLVAGLTPESGAEAAGLEPGDRIVALNDVRLDGADERPTSQRYQEAMSGLKPGDAVTVTFIRNGETRQVEVETGSRGSYMAKVVEEKGPWLASLRSIEKLEDLEALEGLEELEVLKDGKLDLSGDVMRVPAGLRLEDVGGDLAGYFEVDRGVLVLGTPEREAALKGGDILLDIDGQAPASADAALERLAKLRGEVPARVKRRGREQDVVLDADVLNAEQALQVMGGERRIRIRHLGDGDQARLEITVED